MNAPQHAPPNDHEPAGNPGPSAPRGMKVTAIRISEASWEAIHQEAESMGISTAEFIRESTIFRLGYRWAKRMDDDHVVQRLRKIDAHIDVDHY